MKRHAAPRDLAAANAWTAAMLTPSTHLCPFIGIRGTQRFLCRYPAGHYGDCTWRVEGAVVAPKEVRP